MKIVRTLAISAILAAIAALPAYAQGTRPAGTAPARPAATPATTTAAPTTAATTVAVPESKIAFVDTEAFADTTNGIKRFVGALQTLQSEFKGKQDEMIAIQTKMQALAKEIDTLNKAQMVSPATITAKQEEGGRLERELKYKKEDYDAATQKRYRELVGPVSTDIGKELDTFAAQRGITMILDVSKLLPAILTAKEEMDITKAFIAYYNAKNPTTASATTPR